MGKDYLPHCFPVAGSTNRSALLSLQAFDWKAAQAGSQAAEKKDMDGNRHAHQLKSGGGAADALKCDMMSKEKRVSFPKDNQEPERSLEPLQRR
ncbi:hypothetical protein NDU88_001625 [Pleurodeles waltl]|uniref:Uncharacterized protein n=1 Tax=Pleurodeles waltl TaxID=8319 RepID=A0AAV7MKY2_PLEWA|nr:hypothetical protein NDU88_001625 [Pleurodeles waltl]